MADQKKIYRPSAQEIREEIRLRDQKRKLWSVLWSTIFTMMCVAAAAIILATQFFPTLKIYGNSMTPVLEEGEIAFSVKSSSFRSGDVIAFYYNNKLLVKRVIRGPGDWFNLQEDGTVYVNGIKLDEPYIEKLSFGQCDLELPYQVPDEHYFVMGDQRESSVDSRLSQVGCVASEQIVGRIVFCVWPFDKIHKIG